MPLVPAPQNKSVDRKGDRIKRNVDGVGTPLSVMRLREFNHEVRSPGPLLETPSVPWNQQRHETPAIHQRRRRRAAELAERGAKVDVGDHAVNQRARLDTGAADVEWHSDIRPAGQQRPLSF